MQLMMSKTLCAYSIYLTHDVHVSLKQQNTQWKTGCFVVDKSMVGSRGLEPLTSSTSRKRSSQLS